MAKSEDNTMIYLGIAAAAFFLLRSRQAAPVGAVASSDANATTITNVAPQLVGFMPARERKPVETITDNPVPDGWYPDPKGLGSVLYQGGVPVAMTQGGGVQPGNPSDLGPPVFVGEPYQSPPWAPPMPGGELPMAQQGLTIWGPGRPKYIKQ